MRRISLIACCAVVLSVLVSDKPLQPASMALPLAPSSATATKPAAPVISGVASWYGPRFDGRKTANGERFDMHDLTAAHRSLPFGSKVEVKDVRTGKTVRVRINDRGPYYGSRVIDLSYGAARALGIDGDGLASVEIRVIG